MFKPVLVCNKGEDQLTLPSRSVSQSLYTHTLILDSRRIEGMDYELGGFEEWMTAIRETEELAKEYEFVATGHGPVGTWEDVREWREYFDELRAAVEAEIAAGQTLEDMQRSIALERRDDWEGSDWVDENVLGMYHFLTD